METKIMNGVSVLGVDAMAAVFKANTEFENAINKAKLINQIHNAEGQERFAKVLLTLGLTNQTTLETSHMFWDDDGVQLTGDDREDILSVKYSDYPELQQARDTHLANGDRLKEEADAMQEQVSEAKKAAFKPVYSAVIERGILGQGDDEIVDGQFKQTLELDGYCFKKEEFAPMAALKALMGR